MLARAAAGLAMTILDAAASAESVLAIELHLDTLGLIGVRRAGVQQPRRGPDMFERDLLRFTPGSVVALGSGRPAKARPS